MTKLTAATLERFAREPDWRHRQREFALAAFREQGLPDTESEVWKYAPLEQLKLGDLELAEWVDPATLVAKTDGQHLDVAGRVDVRDGVATFVATGHPGLSIVVDSPPADLGTLVGADDAFCALNLALAPSVVVLEVVPGARIDRPVELEVHASGGTSFPRVFVRVGEGSSLQVVEHVTGDSAELVAPVNEYVVGDGASLQVSSIQSLPEDAWSIARTRATLGRDAVLTQLVVGLGGRYDRVRADAMLNGDGASSTLHTAHVGTGGQVHDLRTMQVHVGRRTTSRLYSKAAVSGQSESIYSGLIAMRRGAKRADALQANRSLVLSDGARADAVPNLDIEENDVRCAHASSVGPVDEEQRWYLESRGVEPHDAVRLIVEGFFEAIAGMLERPPHRAELAAAITRLEVGMAPTRPIG